METRIRDIENFLTYAKPKIELRPFQFFVSGCNLEKNKKNIDHMKNGTPPKKRIIHIPEQNTLINKFLKF